MDKEILDDISKDFEKFDIPKELYPLYHDPYQFAKTFKRCSIVEYRGISYSNNASSESKPSQKK